MNYKFLCVDFQNEFVDRNGKWFNGGKSIEFIKNELIPFLIKKQIKISEIISDYRPPRNKDSGVGCIPGEFGYQSALPNEIKENQAWIKCMNSPLWTRNNIGDKNKQAGLPFQDTIGFDRWLKMQFGEPNHSFTIILFGLTLDCCVLATAQELYWRGYNVKILLEATDVMPNKNQEKVKQQIVKGEVLNHWLQFINFKQLCVEIK